MIWFNIKNLEEKLIEGSVTEKEAFNYLLVTMLIFTISPYLHHSDNTNQLISWIEIVFGIIFTAILLKTTFQINGSGDNKEYLTRYIALSLVISIRLFVFILIPLIVFGIMTGILKSNGILIYDNNKELIFLTMGIVVSIIYFFLLTRSFKKVCK